jgi:hypothetical protein
VGGRPLGERLARLDLPRAEEAGRRRCLEAVHTEESSQGPDRVVYRITRQGEGDFFFLLNSAISDVETGQTMFDAALPFFTTLDRATLLFLLRSRIRQV